VGGIHRLHRRNGGSDEILKRAADSYRRIRNTARFLLANLNGFDPAKDMVKPEEMVVLDRWAVGCAQAAQEDILKAYDSYDFHEVVQRLMRFAPSKWARSTSTSSKTASTPRKRTAWRVVAARDCAVPHRRSAGALDGADHVLHRR
jgi:isoleucyl-tRNA synthetase